MFFPTNKHSAAASDGVPCTLLPSWWSLKASGIPMVWGENSREAFACCLHSSCPAHRCGYRVSSHESQFGELSQGLSCAQELGWHIAASWTLHCQQFLLQQLKPAAGQGVGNHGVGYKSKRTAQGWEPWSSEAGKSSLADWQQLSLL